MAIPTNIKTLLSGEVVEWARIEFKETWNAEASLKSVCAFANDPADKLWESGASQSRQSDNQSTHLRVCRQIKLMPVKKIFWKNVS